MMHNFYKSDPPAAAETAPSQTPPIVPIKKNIGARMMDWWHAFASPPLPPHHATVRQREKYRRARSVSVVDFYALLLMLLFLPTTFGLRAFWIALFVTIALAIAPLFNRLGLVLIAGMCIVFSLQGALMFYVLTMTPLGGAALQIYDLFAIVILLALAVLPIRAIWFITLTDCTFIILDFLYQPHNTVITTMITEEALGTVLIRPVILVAAVACAGSVLLINVAKAVRQSYEAEFVANLEHTAAQQNEMEAGAKRELEDSIQQIIRSHTDVMNGRTREHIPYPTAKVLWPIVGILNTLWTRLQSSQHWEKEHIQLQADIMRYNAIVQRSLATPDQPLAPYHTKTSLAPLTLSIDNLHKELMNQMRRTRGNML